MKLTRKVLVGDGAAEHLPFAKDKLALMNLATDSPWMKKAVKRGNAVIIIQKGVPHDKITIMTSQPGWLALGRGAIYGPVYTQLAQAKKPAGPWTEPPGGEVVDKKNTFDVAASTTIRLAEPTNIMVMGDGRYALQFGTRDSTGQLAASFFSYNSKRKYMGLLQLTGVSENGDTLALAQTRFTFPVQQYWAVDERVGNAITFQLGSITYGPAITFNNGGLEFINHSLRYMAVDTDYGTLDSANQPNGFRASFPIVDVQTGGWTIEAGVGAARPYLCFLTPTTILAGTLLGQLDGSDAYYHQKIGTSLDGGKTWELKTFETRPYCGTGQETTSASQPRWCALDAKSALRLSYYGFSNKTIDTGLGGSQTVTDDFGLAIFKVTVVGGHTLVIRPDNAIPWPHIFSSTHNVTSMDMYNLGRNTLVLVATIASSDIDDQREPDYPKNGYIATKSRCRTYCSRSFDGGISWDEPTYTGFYNAGVSQNADRDVASMTTNGVTRSVSYTAYPGSYMYRLYCHKPYNSEDDQGAVYVTAVNLNDFGQPGNLLQLTAPNLTLLYKSVDACRTFTKVGPIGAKGFYTGTDNSGPLYLAPIYLGIVDTAAPIDPIFPWRVDARRTPPDWWTGEL